MNNREFQQIKLEKQAWQSWDNDQKTNPNPVNPHAYVYGYKAGFKSGLGYKLQSQLLKESQPLSPQSSVGVEEKHDVCLIEFLKYLRRNKKDIWSLSDEVIITSYTERPLTNKSNIGDAAGFLAQLYPNRMFSLSPSETINAMTEYSSLMNKEKDEQLKYCHKRMGEAYSEITHLKAKIFAKDALNISLEKNESQLQQLLSEKEKAFNRIHENLILGNYEEANRIALEQLKQSPIN